MGIEGKFHADRGEHVTLIASVHGHPDAFRVAGYVRSHGKRKVRLSLSEPDRITPRNHLASLWGYAASFVGSVKLNLKAFDRYTVTKRDGTVLHYDCKDE